MKLIVYAKNERHALRQVNNIDDLNRPYFAKQKSFIKNRFGLFRFRISDEKEVIE